MKTLAPLVLLPLAFLTALGGESVALKVPPGFEAKEVLAGTESDGSWSAMAVDAQGRFVISPQGSEPMLRVSVAADGSATRVQKLDVPVTSAMGLLFAFDSLYVNGLGPQGFGLYRLRDTKGADVFDEVKLLRKFEGEEASKEHGSHGLALGPDQRLYLAQGNHMPPPKDALPTSPYKNYAEDQLLPSANYGLSSGDKAQAPCGHVLRMDPDGRNVEVFAGGLRNVYALAFSPGGQLFAFDSDTEFNWGQPWYMPCRILHVVSGGEYGFREGTGKWPASYPDSLPAEVNVGLGCPTGIAFGSKSRFPQKYATTLFALDWTFGRILAVNGCDGGPLNDKRVETFLQGRPLNLTAIEFGHDGAMYFITGGRKTRSSLYRVRSTEVKEGRRISSLYNHGKEDLRALESFHGKADAQAIRHIWPHLSSGDPLLRHAAQVALESQPVAKWAPDTLAASEPSAALTALLALARVGSQSDRADVIKNVAMWWQVLNEHLQLDALRVAEVALARHGQPYPESQSALLKELNPAYPAKSAALNRELCQLLIALKAPHLVPRTLGLLRQAATFEEQLHYVFHLRLVREGWSAAEREEYFRWFTQPHPAEAHSPEMKQWFADVHLHYADGGSLRSYLTHIREEAAETLTQEERSALAPLLGAPLLPPLKPVEVAQHSFVKAWTAAELLPLVERMAQPRSMERGREVFTAAACIACHRYANEGGAIGPDLNAVAYKLGVREMLESIIEPSKMISDQFQNTIIELANGETRTVRILKKSKDKVAFSVNPMGGDSEEMARSRIRSMKPSPLSPMPSGLLNPFTQDEVLDLLAYLGFGAP